MLPEAFVFLFCTTNTAMLANETSAIAFEYMLFDRMRYFWQMPTRRETPHAQF